MKEQEQSEIKIRTDEYEIVEMPSKEILEEYLRKGSGQNKRLDVVFRLDKGIFEVKPLIKEQQ